VSRLALVEVTLGHEEGRMGRVLADYVTAVGWGVVGAISMAAGLAILLKVLDWLTPINEWAEIQKGNVSVAIIMAAVILALGIAVGFAIMPVPAVRP
jgi:uncharacterized membrane protein YjfL (UPF0719 family)